MTANATTTSVAYVFKNMFDSGVGDEATRLHPTLDIIPKPGGWGGSDFTYSVKIGNAQNITSGAIALAQAVGSGSKGVKFTMVRKKKTGTISMDIEALLAAKETSEGAFAELVVTEVDGFVSEFYDRLGFDLFRDGYGMRGRRSSASTNVITLSNPDDARNFKVNMSVSAAQNSDGTSARAGSTTIAGVDTDAGTITLASAAAITSFADNDYLFAAPEVGSNIEGFEMLTPLTTPTATTVRGVDRTIYTSLLAGVRVNDTATSIEENAGKCAVKIRQNGGRADTLVLNPQRAWEMGRRLGAKVEYQGGGGTAVYGFEKFMISTPAGVLAVISDPDCQTDRGRVFLNSAHKIKTLKEFVHIGNEDGNYELRMPTDDALESRVRSMSNYYQPTPRDHGVFAI
jgi:hypothetical protein